MASASSSPQLRKIRNRLLALTKDSAANLALLKELDLLDRVPRQPKSKGTGSEMARIKVLLKALGRNTKVARRAVKTLEMVEIDSDSDDEWESDDDSDSDSDEEETPRRSRKRGRDDSDSSEESDDDSDEEEGKTKKAKTESKAKVQPKPPGDNVILCPHCKERGDTGYITPRRCCQICQSWHCNCGEVFTWRKKTPCAKCEVTADARGVTRQIGGEDDDSDFD